MKTWARNSDEMWKCRCRDCTVARQQSVARLAAHPISEKQRDRRAEREREARAEAARELSSRYEDSWLYVEEP